MLRILLSPFLVLLLIVPLTASCTEQGLESGSGDDVAVIDTISDEAFIEPPANEPSPQEAPPEESPPNEPPDQDADQDADNEPDPPDPNDPPDNQLLTFPNSKILKPTTRVGDDCKGRALLQDKFSDKSGILAFVVPHDGPKCTIFFSKEYSRRPICVASSTHEEITVAVTKIQLIFGRPHDEEFSRQTIYYMCELPEE